MKQKHFDGKRLPETIWSAVNFYGLWMLVSLLAIAIVGDQALAGLVIAILGGVALGLTSILRIER